MTRVEASILVPGAVEEVFLFLDAPESHLKFIPRMTEFKQTSPGEFGTIGANVKGLLNYFGVRIPVEYEIIEHQPNKQLAMKGRMGRVVFKDGYVLNREQDGTKIKFWLELNPMGWAKVFLPFARLIGRVHAWETLRNLKRELAAWRSSTDAEIASSETAHSSQ